MVHNKIVHICLFILISCVSINGQELAIYVSDAGNFNDPPWQILKYDEMGQSPSVFIDSALNWPQDILFLEDQNTVLISNFGTGLINKHNASTGEYIGPFASALSAPTRIKIGPDSLIYVLQWGGTGRVKRYTVDGANLGPFTSAGVPQSIGLDWDTQGNLYVSSYSDDMVRKFDTDGDDLGIFIGFNLLGPTDIWFDSNGDLLVSDYNGSAVKRFNSSGGYLGDFITGLSRSEGVAHFPNGNILIGNGFTQSVKLFDSTGAYIEDLIPSGFGGLLTPNAIVLREIPTLAVSDENLKLPDSPILITTYPNPFNARTIVTYSVPVAGHVSLTVHDYQGRLVKSLVSTHLPSGSHETSWDAVYDSGELAATGLYFLRLQAGNSLQTTKMLLLK